MTKPFNRLWITVLLLGWLADFLFWGQANGINFPIFLSASLIGGFAWLLSNQQKPARQSLWLLVPFAFFASLTCLRQEPLTIFLAYTFSLFSVGVLTVTYLDGRWTKYSLLDYLAKLFFLFESVLSQPLGYYAQIRKEQAERGETPRKWPIIPILRGLLLALPVVACFAALLASADLIFSQKLSELFKNFNSGEIFEHLLRLGLIFLWAYILAASFLHAGSKSQDEKLLGEEKPVVKPFLGLTEAAMILGSVTVLFLLFVIIQFRYFFGGNVNIGLEGFTYSQYARRGFNELVLVAFFVW